MNTKLLEKKMENISPFELKNRLIDMADESLKKTARTMLNAGRGNPNWIATTPREAFFLLGKFGLEECRHVMFLPEGIAGIPEKQGIAARFEQFLKSNTYQPGAKLLEQTYHYMLMQHAVDPDSLVHEWAESVIGNQYPVPDRILQFTEMLVCDYLNQEMCDNRPPRGAFNLFATEGGTAAMCYIFDSLQENFLLDKENSYKQKMQEIIRRRLQALWDNTGFTLVEDPLRVGYYTEIDMLVWAEKFYGEKFVEYLKKTYSPLNVVFRLAQETSLVLLNGGGFDGPEWSVRASLANLNESDYITIGQGIKRILDEYAEEWRKNRS